MSASILSGDFAVHFAAENNQKRIEWTGSSDGTRTLNELYSAVQSLFDDPAQMDDLVPLKADTPDIYRIQNQWFIDDTSVEHLTGGALFSDKWKDGTTEHVLVIGLNPSTNFNLADIGRTLVGGTTGDTATLLDFNHSRQLAWIRPVDPLTAGDEFDDDLEGYTVQSDDVAHSEQEDNGTGFTDQTASCNSAADNDIICFPAVSAVNDAFYIGFAQKFSQVIFDRLSATLGTGGVIVYEYSQGGGVWGTLAGVTDQTASGGVFGNAALADGDTLTYTVPTDWATDSVDSGSQLYWIRVRVTTGYTIEPQMSQIFISGVGAGSFAAHTRHGGASQAGESAWAGITTIGSIETDSHIYIFQEDPDGLALGFSEVKVTATKGSSDWWGDGQIDILLKTKEGDSIFGRQPASGSLLGIATILARQYSKFYSHFIAGALSTAGGNTVVPLSAGDDLDNITGTRNQIWDGGSSETLVDEERLYVVGVAGVGNLDAVVNEAPVSTFADDTADANSVATGDVAVWQATEAVNDAMYFGKDNTFSLLMVDIGTQGVASAASTIWEYFDGTTWQTLTVTDDSNSGNGAFTAATGRRLISWTVPSDWGRTNVTNQPAAAPTNLFYVRVRITGANYTTLPVLDTVWVGGEVQLKARVADTVIVTAGGATGNADYYLIGDPLVDLVDNDVIIAATSRKTFDVNGGPTNVGPTLDTTITVVFGATTENINNGNGARPYSIRIDPASIAIARLYERMKWNVRRGSTESLQGQDGEEYVGDELQIEYTGMSGSFVEGNEVTQATTNARGVIVADHNDGATGDLILKAVRGTFAETGTLTEGGNTAATASTRVIAPVLAAPFGTFAGGKFFGAPGVALTIANLIGADTQAFQLVDDEGTVQIPPNTVSMTITNLITGDTVSVFRRTGTVINKTQFTLAAANDKGNVVVVVNEAIASDNPPSGKVRLISTSGAEHRYRFASFLTSTFTLDAAKIATADASGSNTVLDDADGNFLTAPAVEPGDLIRNTTDDFFVKVLTVTATQLTTEDGGATWNSKAYNINSLVENYPTNNNAYVPIIERIADAVTETNTVVHSTDIDIRVDVRNAGVILPFTQDTDIVSTGRSVPAVRNPDDIFT